jgi:hypothetical protein
MCKKQKQEINKAVDSGSTRRLLVIDIENYCGKPVLTQKDVASAKQSVFDRFSPTANDLIVIGVSHTSNFMSSGISWKGARHVLGKGQNGADLAIINALGEYRLDSFKEVVLMTGDGIFANKVKQMVAAGAYVTVVSCAKRLSRNLAAVGSSVQLVKDRTKNKKAA